MQRNYRLPPVRSPFRRLAITFGVIVGAITAIGAGLYIHGRLTPQHRLLIDNGHAFTVDVEVDGDRFTISARSSTTIEVKDGRHSIRANGPGFREEVTLDLPDTGWNTTGRTALYSVGGVAPLAIVTMTYGSTFNAPPTVFLHRDQKVIVLPLDVTGDIDQPFPAQIESHSAGGVIRHVCHVEGERFKCAEPNR